ncbi:MAG TPA: YciI family protein [Burkholderiales bacterium]|nr:YciI family protein [Burkholderiales bacterium]
MLWAISRVAAPRFATLRERHLQAHLDYLRSRKSILVVSGATLTDDGGEVIGSLLIVNVGSRAEADAFADGDPFAKAGMFKSVTITRMRKGQWNPEAAEGA